MLPDSYVKLAQYNEWMNSKVYRIAAEIDEQDRKKDAGAFFGSIHLTLSHILVTDRAWLARITANPQEFRFLDQSGEPIRITHGAQDVYPDFTKLRLEREATDLRILEVARDFSQESLTENIQYLDSAGAPCDHPRWWAASHLFNHQTHHRGQVTTIFKQLGVDPGVTDFLMYLRDAA